MSAMNDETYSIHADMGKWMGGQMGGVDGQMDDGSGGGGGIVLSGIRMFSIRDKIIQVHTQIAWNNKCNTGNRLCGNDDDDGKKELYFVVSIKENEKLYC